jgi:hypothetical protein
MSSVAVTPAIDVAFSKSSGLRAQLEASLSEQLSSTLLMRERAAPVTVPVGIAALDELTGGLPRGGLTEIAGPASSGRTGVMLAALARATRREEVCALVDASDSFDPASAAIAGVDLQRLLWVRCSTSAAKTRRTGPGAPPGSGFAFGGALEQVLKVTDLLLQAGGFGMVVLDLGDIPSASARRVPLTSWFRFRRAVEPTATVLLLIDQEPCAKTCASLVLRMQAEEVCASDTLPNTGERMSVSSVLFDGFGQTSGEKLVLPKTLAVTHSTVLRGVRFRAQVERSWSQRKPPQSVGAGFELRAAM